MVPTSPFFTANGLTPGSNSGRILQQAVILIYSVTGNGIGCRLNVFKRLYVTTHHQLAQKKIQLVRVRYKTQILLR